MEIEIIYEESEDLWLRDRGVDYIDLCRQLLLINWRALGHPWEYPTESERKKMLNCPAHGDKKLGKAIVTKDNRLRHIALHSYLSERNLPYVEPRQEPPPTGWMDIYAIGCV